MLFANRYDVDNFVDLTRDGSTPNAHRLALTVRNLRDWADDNSDGWAFWPAPARAATSAVAYLQRLEIAWHREGFIADIPAAEVAHLLSPVKAFLTRRDVAHDDVIATDDEARASIAPPAPATVELDTLELGPAMHLEAVCECGETFIPADEDDLEHAITEAGDECGRRGVIVGSWHFTPKGA